MELNGQLHTLGKKVLVPTTYEGGWVGLRVGRDIFGEEKKISYFPVPSLILFPSMQ
jgi:hypothetical protein